MAKPTYRLQVLLDMKEKAEKAATEEVSRAQEALAAERRKLAEMQAELERMVEHRQRRRLEFDEDLRQGRLRLQQMPQIEQYLKRLQEEEAAFRETFAEQEERVAAAVTAVEQAQAALVEAAKERKAMEKHKEKFLEKARREQAAKEADQQDEIGQMIHMMKR